MPIIAGKRLGVFAEVVSRIRPTTDLVHIRSQVERSCAKFSGNKEADAIARSGGRTVHQTEPAAARFPTQPPIWRIRTITEVRRSETYH